MGRRLLRRGTAVTRASPSLRGAARRGNPALPLAALALVLLLVLSLSKGAAREICPDESPCNRAVHLGIGYTAAEIAGRAGLPRWVQCFGAPGAVALVNEQLIDDNPGVPDGAAFVAGGLLNCALDVRPAADGAPRLALVPALAAAPEAGPGMFLELTIPLN